jgi:DNA-binding transcriptional ArsR family regulator
MVAPLVPDARLFAALGDETRLSLLDRLQHEPACSTTTLAAGTGLSRQAVRKHLGVLAEVGLVRHRREGRERLWSLDARPLQQVHVWSEAYRRFWERRLDQLDAFLVAQDAAEQAVSRD